MKNILFVLLLFTSYVGAQAQGGAQIFSGLTRVQNTNSLITDADHIQSGFTIGIQSRLKDGSFVAGPGLKYTRITMMSEKELNFFNKNEQYHFVSMPVNVGLEYRLSYLWKLRMYTGADANYFYKIDDNPYKIDLEYVHDFFFGAHAGVGVDFYWITFDIIYEHGLTDAYKFENSRNNFLTATIGFFF